MYHYYRYFCFLLFPQLAYDLFDCSDGPLYVENLFHGGRRLFVFADLDVACANCLQLNLRSSISSKLKSPCLNIWRSACVIFNNTQRTIRAICFASAIFKPNDFLTVRFVVSKIHLKKRCVSTPWDSSFRDKI